MQIQRDYSHHSQLAVAESERRQERMERAERVCVGAEFRLCRGVFAFGEIIDPSRGIKMRSPGPVKPGLYRVWRLDHGGQRVVLLSLPPRSDLHRRTVIRREDGSEYTQLLPGHDPPRGPELYDERFVSVDIGEMSKFRVEHR